MVREYKKEHDLYYAGIWLLCWDHHLKEAHKELFKTSNIVIIAFKEWTNDLIFAHLARDPVCSLGELKIPYSS